MKKIKLFILMTVFSAVGLMAQDPVHGVDGYYAYTAKQLQSEDKVRLDPNGTKIAQWNPALTYEGDYMKVRMGINNATPVALGENQKYFDFRTGIQMKEAVAGQGVLTITKEYPVLAFKFSMPKNNETLALPSVNNQGNYMEPEYRWYNPVTGAAEKVPLSGLDGNGRHRHILAFPAVTDSHGRDSLQIASRYDNGKARQIWRGARVDDMTDIVFYVDFSHIFDEGITVAEVNHTFDSFKLGVGNLGIGFFARADTLKSTPVRDGITGNITSYTYSTETKSLDEMPTFYFKWIRTFESAEAFDEFVSYNNGDGNDPRSDNQLLLNTKLYQANEMAESFKFSDESVLNPLTEAIAAATTAYQSTAPNSDKTSAEWQAWDATILQAIDDLTAAQNTFLASIAMVQTDIYNKITSADGNYELRLGETRTIGNYTGQVLEFGGLNSGSGFLVKPIGEVNGQKAYTLSTAKGTVVVSKDTLILVPVAQLTASNAAPFIFSNRSSVDEPLFDIKSGINYYHVTEEGKLGATAGLPQVENLEDLVRYLFVISDATDTYDASGDTAPLFEGWEFNDAITQPTNQWETDTLKVEGWRMNRYRMHTRVNQEVKDGQGCLTVKASDTYYAQADTFHTAPLATAYPTLSLIMREHGKYANLSSPEPIGSVRDSLYLININSYKKRYMAVKWGATNPDVTLESFSLFAKKGVEEYGLTPANSMGRKQDVYYWDLLAAGIPFGDKGFPAQYMSFNNFAGPNDVVYVDWVRTYSSIDEIPDEAFSFTTGIEGEEANAPVKVSATGKTIYIGADAKAQVYVSRIDGVVVAKQAISGSAEIPVQAPGLYLVTVVLQNKPYTTKVIIK